MSLCVAAYPKLSTADFERIQEFRKRNDVYYPVIGPHFTPVFPLTGWEVEPFIAEVKKQAWGIQAFEFCIRCASLDKDATNDYYHAFLVPDEGYSRIVKLHDRLYADRLFPCRALTIDFIPHIGIGNSKDPLRCLEMIEHWNKTEFAITGQVQALDIAKFENNRVQTLERFELSEAAG